MNDAPSGTVTFLFTDIEGSTSRWEERPDEMRGLVARHDELVRGSIERHDGYIFATAGDGFAAAFARAADAVAAAAALQRALDDLAGIEVRMGINTGEVQERDGDYFGPAVNRTARLMAAGHGGQVLVSGVTAAVVTDVELRYLGEHRLRDLGQAMAVFQLGTDDHPALRSLGGAPSNLPLQLTTFVGRDTEIRALGALLVEQRVVTITGVGGVGKTRLAMHVAAEALSDSPDGVWLGELASVDTAESLAEVVATALNVSAGGSASLVDAIVDAIRTKRMLLLLDNCEHLLLDVADLVDAVLVGCPQVRILATSREGLGVDGERVWPLRSLAVPAADAAGDAVAASAAVRLFVDRARAVAPTFTVDRSNAAAVAEICRRLDGIPLAIELAAARLTAMQPQEIASHLDERFRLLTGGKRRGTERHQTLRATVDWSYSLLGERDRRVFDRLSVFAGGFDVAAAHAIVAETGLDRLDVLDTLNELVAKSMVVAEPGIGGETRYSLLETLRQYGLEQLDEQAATDHARRDHAAHFAAVAETAGPELISRNELAWRPKVVAEIDNIRAAVTWALDRDDPDDGELAMRIIAALAMESVLNRAGGIGGWAEQAIASGRHADSPHRPTVLVAATFGAYHRLAPEVALDYIASAGVTPATPREFAMTEAVRANILLQTGGDIAEVVAISRGAVETLVGDDDVTLAARVLLCPAPIFTVLAGDHDAARAMADQLVADARRLGQPTALALARYSKGFVLHHIGVEPDAATDELEASIALTRAGASDAVYAQALNVLALRHAMVGRTAESLAELRASIEHSTRANDLVSNISALTFAAVALARAGVDDAAAVCVGSSRAGFLSRNIQAFHPRGAQETFAEVERRLGPRRWLEATDRGAAMEYDELMAFVVDALDDDRDDALAAPGDQVSRDAS